MRAKSLSFLIAASLSAVFCGRRCEAQQVKELTFWSHWAAEEIKRKFVEEAISSFEAKNPGVKIKPTWYEKTALYAALKTALRAGPGAGHLLCRAGPGRVHRKRLPARPLEPQLGGHRAVGEGGLDLQGQALRPAARSLDRRALLQQEAMADLGVKRAGQPAALRPTHSSTWSRRRRPKSITPMALGVGDRPFPGAHLTHEALLKRLGVDDYDKLLTRQAALDRPARRRHAEAGCGA